MVLTSFKVDRELFAADRRIAPSLPKEVVISPYVDTDYYHDASLESERSRHVRASIGRVLQVSHVELPPDQDATSMIAQACRGVFLRLSRVLPASLWDGDEKDLTAAAAKSVTPEMVSEAVHNVDRRLSIGPMFIQSYDHQDCEPLSDRSIANRWLVATPEVATLVDRNDKSTRRRIADVHYDFNKGNQIDLRQTVRLSFDSSQVHRMQISVQPDDSWHDIMLSVESSSGVWTASRAIALGNMDWTTLIWQPPSSDDDSLKVKHWVVLNPDSSARSTVTDPRELKLTLSVIRASRSRAWWNKFKQNYQRVFDAMPVTRYLRVSLFLVIANVVLTLLSSSLAAYAFARIAWPGRDLLFLLMLATLMIPSQVLMIPRFLMWKSLGAYDTLTPLWLGAAFGNAFFIFLLRQFMRGIPPDLEEAARIDGCGFLRIYWHVVLPLIKPALAAIAIFTFMASWNDFMGPLLYLADQRLYPLAFGVYALALQVQSNPTLTMAASLMMTIPVIAIFFAAQRYFVQGITLTGIKG